MTRSDAEPRIRYLIPVWRQQEPQQELTNSELSATAFIAWLRQEHPRLLVFRSPVPVTYLIEMWFDQELNQTWRN